MAVQDWPLLVRLCKQALRKNRSHLLANRLLGFSFNKLRQTDDALRAYRQAVAIFPDDSELLVNFGALLVALAQNFEALPLLEKAAQLRPNKAACWIELAHCCYAISLHEKGFQAAEKAISNATLSHERVSALSQRAIHRREFGQVKEAVADCEAAIAIDPENYGSHANRLLFMLADPETDDQQLADAAKSCATVFEPLLQPCWPSFTELHGAPWRKLRIGFLSPDFRIHSVMYFVEGVLAQLDRRQFEVFAFYLYPKEDHVTQRVERHVDHFVRLAGAGIDEQVSIIRSHQVDIVIDLAGHTGHNGLLAMARKVAPVQATWVGFPGTTGLKAIDYLISDQFTDPEGVDSLYTERLFRLPTRLCAYRPMSRNPLWRYQPRYLVQASPAISNGFVTFGSCNNLGKITDEVLLTWARILSGTPGSRLLIEGKNFERPDFAAAYLARCEQLGIDPRCLDLVPLNTDNQYLTYHRIDIALDPFPLNGGTTSMDVLWMGVPMVALEGKSFKSRLSTGILMHLGRGEWLAPNTEEYVAIACGLAADIQKLNAVRLGLRQEVENSVLMREDVFCLHFGNALRTMWLQWTAEQQAPGDAQTQSKLIEAWRADAPSEWSHLPIPGVGLSPGKRMTINEAHKVLEQALAKAKSVLPKADSADGKIENIHWADLTELAETVLTAVPHDAVALSCLAEVEFAHGHTDFAVTYLRHAVAAMGTAAL
ncbi:MAG: acetylglucosamine transferase [Betaproteobacteria bacterium]|nr:acetylglucosamine transferase [Betaproteobacteria bacterium]MBP7780310.1 acetylglucosamine transferase [Burkholderiaceae bacterium]